MSEDSRKLCTDIPLVMVDTPWERLPLEHDRAWSAFQAFLKQDKPRAVYLLAKTLDISKVTLYKYMKKWRWREREACYEHALSMDLEKGARSVVPDIGAEHARVLSKMRKICEIAIDDLVVEAQRIEGNKVPIGQIMTLLDKVIYHERLLYGFDTERTSKKIEASIHTKEEVKVDLSLLSDEELDQLVKIEDKLAEK